MNRANFHNRNAIKEEYLFRPGNYRCIICSYQYHPEYHKKENAFLLLSCNHLIHRQCLKSCRSIVYDDWKDQCELCEKVGDFQDSALKVSLRRQERLEYDDSHFFEKVVATVEKTGRFRFK